MKRLDVRCRELWFDMSAEASEVKSILLKRGRCEVVFTPIQVFVQQSGHGRGACQYYAIGHNLVVLIPRVAFTRS